MSERISVALKGVSKRFGELAAVNAVDLQVARGEFFSLLGPSGCGKTTTLRMIGGLTTPDQGDVLINSVRVNDVPPYKRDASIVFQNLALFPHLTVAGNIAYGLKLRRLPREHIDRKVAEMLELVQLSGLDKRRPDQLSGGQQQRVAVARSLVLQPEVLLLDEPLAALDRKLRKEMQIELRRIQRDVGITFIYVTHDQKEALSMSDRIAVMKDGKVAQLGTPRQIYERPASKFVAGFMGAANVFDVRVTQQDDSLVTLQTERGTEILATVAQLQPDLTTMGCSIRPEAIRLSATSDGAIGHNRHQGTIVSMVYLGDVIEVTVGLATSDHMVAFLPTTARQMALEEGQTVEVSWSASDSNLLVA